MDGFEKLRLASLAASEQDLAEVRKNLARQLKNSEAAWGAVVYLREIITQQILELDATDKSRVDLTEYLDIQLSLLGLLTLRLWSCESPSEFLGDDDMKEFTEFV